MGTEAMVFLGIVAASVTIASAIAWLAPFPRSRYAPPAMPVSPWTAPVLVANCAPARSEYLLTPTEREAYLNKTMIT